MVAQERADRAEETLAEQEEWGMRWREECEGLRGKPSTACSHHTPERYYRNGSCAVDVHSVNEFR